MENQFSGKDFIPVLTNNEKADLKVTASLDSRETLESELIEFKDESPDFNTELVWTMDRLTFQGLRSRKALLKLHVLLRLDEGDKTIGTLIFDLKEAIPKPKPNPDESYITHAIWRRLKVPDLPAGKPAPSIRAAFVIEPNAPNGEADLVEEEDMTVVDDEELQSQVMDPQEKLTNLIPTRERFSPVLDNEKGHFTIGCPSPDSQIFLFNIFICFAQHVQMVT